MNLLALHGFTQTPAQWGEVFDEVQAPWLPGHGPTPNLEGRSFDDVIDRILESAHALPAPRVLLGYSMGARVALGVLSRDSSLFERAVLIGVQPGLSSASERAARAEWEGGLIRLLEQQGLEAFLEEWESLPLFADQEQRTTTQAAARRAHTAHGLAHALSILGLSVMPDYREDLGTIRCRVELVVGARDTKFLGIAEQIRPLLRFGRLHVIEAAGHNPLLDAPAETRLLLRDLAIAPDAR